MDERGDSKFRSVGGLLPTVSIMPESEACPTAKSSNSETTTLPRARSLRTSRPAGERGLTTTSSSPPSVWQADRGLEASFPAPLKILLRSKARYDSQFDALLRYEPLPPAKTPAAEAMIEQARQALDAALVPAEPAAVLKMLARLKISTSSRNRDGDDAKLERRVFADELRRYPLDVVDEACRRWARREQWWPSIAEIVGECDKLVNWRRVTREALG